jgi:hypothetical protein
VKKIPNLMHSFCAFLVSWSRKDSNRSNFAVKWLLHRWEGKWKILLCFSQVRYQTVLVKMSFLLCQRKSDVPSAVSKLSKPVMMKIGRAWYISFNFCIRYYKCHHCGKSNSFCGEKLGISHC